MGLAVVFLVILAGITIFKLMIGSIMMPRLFPHLVDFASVFNLFTVVPIVVTAYICHYNGMQANFYTLLMIMMTMRICGTPLDYPPNSKISLNERVSSNICRV